MRNKLAIIILFFFIIIYFLSSCSFAYTDTTIQQDLYYYAYQDTLVLQNLFNRCGIKSGYEFYNYIATTYPNLNVGSSDFLYFGILHSDNDPYRYDLIFYNDSSLSDASVVDNYNYFGIVTQGFTLSNYVIIKMSSSVSANSKFVSSASKVSTVTTLPSIYYKNSREILFSHIDENTNYNNILNTINNNISSLRNDVSSNTQVQQQTQNFVKNENEVDDNTINDFTNDINVDTVDSSSSANIFELFGIIDSQDNVQTTEIPINFSFFGQNVSFTIGRYLTSNLLYTVLGDTGGGLVSNAIRLIWTYFIFIFLVKNILSLIDKIKAGEIDKINTKNVLVDVL